MRCIAIMGRPNVGKSTLFNRLAGKKLAIVHDEPGVTRDRKMATASLGGDRFTIIDTPGLEEAAPESLAGRMTEQSLKALEDADAILFVIDARTGITLEDEHFAALARRSGLPVVLVANKAESQAAMPGVAEAYALGFGEPVAFSAEHGLGQADLYDALAPHIIEPEEEEETEEPSRNPDEDIIQIAIVGRPNVGKSTLMNKLLGEERMLTGPMAGITRDAVLVETQLGGRTVRLVDTAGMRRKAKVQESLEVMSVGDTLRSLRYAQAVVLMIDATQPLEKQDNAIAALIEREGRACVIAVNKWDLVAEKPDLLLEDIRYRLEDVASHMKGIAVIPISAADGKGLDKLTKAIFKTYALWNRRITTSELNRWLEEALGRHTPPLVSGRRLKIRYATQAKSRPPGFFLFCNRADVPESYVQYLRNSLRETFDLPGIPIRLTLRTGKNPYAEGE